MSRALRVLFQLHPSQRIQWRDRGGEERAQAVFGAECEVNLEETFKSVNMKKGRSEDLIGSVKKYY